MTLVNKIKQLSEDNGGIISAHAAAEMGMSGDNLSKLVMNGVLERVERGIYVLNGGINDELFSIQQRARRIVYSHETALFLLGLSDRTPLRLSVTVPSTYNASKAVRGRCKLYFVKSVFLDIGKISVSSKMGHEIECYDAERTICDVVRSRSRIDPQILTDALKRYVKRADLNRMSEYARLFSVHKILRQYLEVLL